MGNAGERYHSEGAVCQLIIYREQISEMAECPKCQMPCESDDRFCSHCGERLAAAEFSNTEGRTQKALSLSDIHYNLGMVYFKKGEYPKALEYWEKGIRQDPGNEFLQKCIADLKEKMKSE